MNITSLTNPQWANEEQTLINCNITISEFGNQVLPFTASADDVEAHGREIYADIISGKYGPIAAYEPPTAEQLAVEVRAKRDRLLAQLDAITTNPLRWAALSQEQQTDYATYRQALLDVPQQSGFPTDIVWPTLPQ
jgi:hypothetical protein